jgi:hypothetical protein
MKDASEAGFAVLENQLRSYQPLAASENGAVVIKVDSDGVDMDRLLAVLRDHRSSDRCR